MKAISILPYFKNLFWLLLPVLLFNVMFIKYLPPAYQMETFWKNIPSWIRVPENLFRVPVFMLPLLMRFDISTASHKAGFGLYIAGILLYFAAWGALILFPGSAWCRSAAGFMAPAFTPAVWLTGIGLMGDSLTIPALPYKPWAYFSVAGLFLLFHNIHAWLIHSRHG